MFPQLKRILSVGYHVISWVCFSPTTTRGLEVLLGTSNHRDVFSKQLLPIVSQHIMRTKTCANPVTFYPSLVPRKHLTDCLQRQKSPNTKVLLRSNTTQHFWFSLHLPCGKYMPHRLPQEELPLIFKGWTPSWPQGAKYFPNHIMFCVQPTASQLQIHTLVDIFVSQWPRWPPPQRCPPKNAQPPQQPTACYHCLQGASCQERDRIGILNGAPCIHSLDQISLNRHVW